MLEITDLTIRYGDVAAVRNANLRVEQGEIVGLLGSNGAGKSTLLMGISGARPRISGYIKLQGVELVGKKPMQVARAGITQVPEGRRIFPTLSVEDNLRIGAFLSQGNLRKNLSRVYELFPILKDRRRIIGSALSGGEQQMLALGRALMSDPKIVLMDEPSLGLAPLIVRLIYDVIAELRDEGFTFLIVEQNMSVVLRAASRAYVMKLGEMVWSGPSRDLLNNDQLKSAYLGDGSSPVAMEGSR